VRAARVAAGAQQQGRLWPFLEAFYAGQGQENSGYVTDAFLRQVSAAAGVDASAAFAQADGGFASAQLQRANDEASAAGVSSTPTFRVAVGNGAAKTVDASSLLTVLAQDTAR
jgi:protein-disulfide isomerase